MSGVDLSWRRIGRVAPDVSPDFRPRRRSLPPSLAEEIRIARGDAQAVVRILSFRRGSDAVLRTARYVVAKAEAFSIGDGLELEPDEVGGVVASWACDFSPRANARDVMHLEVSAPPGSDHERFVAAACEFAAGAFGQRHPFLLAEHRDTEHPHCHLLVKMRGVDGHSLDPRKADLVRWRECLASAARAHGIPLAASSCRDRGVRPSGISRAAYAMRATQSRQSEADLER